MAAAAKKTVTAEAPAPKPQPRAPRAARTTPTAPAKTRLSLVGGTPARKAPSPPKKAAFPQMQAAMAALENSRSNTFLCDADMNIVYANAKSYEILEFMEPNLHRHSDSWKSFRAADVVGMGLDFLFVDEPVEFRRASDPRHPSYQGRIKTGPCTCDIQVTALKDENGSVFGYAVDWERITDKLAQEARVQQLVMTLEKSTSNTFLCDLDMKVVYANKKSFDILEFMEPNLHRHSDSWKFFHAKDVIGTSLDFLFTDEPEHYQKAKDPRSHPYQCTIKTGPCTCDVTVTSTKDDKGSVTGYAVYWERITEKVAQEARVKQLVTVLENSTANTFLCDLNWCVLYANKKSFDILEFMEPNLHRHDARWHSFRAKEIVGKSLDWLFTDEPEEFRKASDPRNHPYRANIKTGPCTCDVTITSTKNDKGEPTGYAIYWERITERLEMEAKVQAQVEEGRYLSAKVEEMKAAAMAITQGDLTQHIPVDRDDAVGQLAGALNDMVANLSQLVAQVQVASESIVEASGEVAAGNDDLSRRTEEQASSLEETASSMEEMTSTVKQNADNARQANQLAAQAREVAEKGGAVVGSAVGSMDEINKASKRIADIISVIDEIAFQTNLLALNAAVEAARVGEQGRGFAVVATEVRNLAGRSATAAKEIKTLVQDSVQKVQEGSTLVNQSGRQLDEIVSSVKKVADIIAEISAASQEQSAGIEQVNTAIMQMDQITQQNAALVEEATASSQAMSRQAKDLQSVVRQFRIDDAYLDAAQTALTPETPAPSRHAAPAARRVTASAAPARPAARLQRPAPARAASHAAFDDGGFEEF